VSVAPVHYLAAHTAGFISGRQSGKSRIAATVAAFEAMNQTEGGTHALLVAQDHRVALRVVAKYGREPFESIPMLRRSVANTTGETIRQW